jgi:hypothetical protein
MELLLTAEMGRGTEAVKYAHPVIPTRDGRWIWAADGILIGRGKLKSNVIFAS